MLTNKQTNFLVPSGSLMSGSSLSSPLSSGSNGSNPEPAVNLSHGMFHSPLKTYLFFKS